MLYDYKAEKNKNQKTLQFSFVSAKWAELGQLGVDSHVQQIVELQQMPQYVHYIFWFLIDILKKFWCPRLTQSFSFHVAIWNRKDSYKLWLMWKCCSFDSAIYQYLI